MSARTALGTIVEETYQAVKLVKDRDTSPFRIT